MKNRARIVIASALAAAMAAMAPAPAAAGPTEMAMLSTYSGDWRGEGVVRGGNRPEAFRCRLNIAPGNINKINYTGRCTLVDANLSISGTIAYSDQNRRYEAVMSSNAGYSGTAVGRQSGQQITFDLEERQTDRSGTAVRIGARILLVSQRIVVDFEIEFNNSGQVLTTTVPFAR